MEKPSATLLLTWRAILRRVDDTGLSLLRQRLLLLGEDHPDFISAIDTEVQRRTRGPSERRAAPRPAASKPHKRPRKRRCRTPIHFARARMPRKTVTVAPHPHE